MQTCGTSKIHYEWAGAEHLPVAGVLKWPGYEPANVGSRRSRNFLNIFAFFDYDTRGHGQSGVTPGPYTIEQLSSDVVRLLDALQVDRVYFCGLSMGGMTGMFLARTRPKRFHKIGAMQHGRQNWHSGDLEHAHPGCASGGMKAMAASVIERWLTPGFPFGASVGDAVGAGDAGGGKSARICGKLRGGTGHGST